jgi:DNA mismatch repair protein MutS
MEQYLELRRQLPPNTLLLFRLGDFYEMFDSDAREGSAILGITLTQRNGQPMAGIPYHAADGYVQKLLNAGKKVAICDQMEPPRPGKIVRRQLTRILTPGTALEEHQLESRHGSYLLAIDFVRAPRTSEATIAAAWLDLTTGDFVVAHEAHPADLMPVMTALDPAKFLSPQAPLNGGSKSPTPAPPAPVRHRAARSRDEHRRRLPVRPARRRAHGGRCAGRAGRTAWHRARPRGPRSRRLHPVLREENLCARPGTCVCCAITAAATRC